MNVVLNPDLEVLTRWILGYALGGGKSLQGMTTSSLCFPNTCNDLTLHSHREENGEVHLRVFPES
jgi:hypothetical protein